MSLLLDQKSNASDPNVPANFYRGARFTWHQRRRHALVRRLTKGIQGKRILDYGCGYGDLTFALSQTNSIVGIDVDADRIAFCRQQYPELEFLEFDGLTAPFPDASFDFVLSSVVLPFVPDHRRYLRDVARQLTDDGTLILVSRNFSVVRNALRRLAGRTPVIEHLNKASATDLATILNQAGFDVTRRDYFYDPPFIDWNSPMAYFVGAMEQVLSALRIAKTASYFAFSAKKRLLE